MNTDKGKQVAILIATDRNITIAELCEILQMSHDNLVQSLSYLMLYVKWVPRMLMTP